MCKNKLLHFFAKKLAARIENIFEKYFLSNIEIFYVILQLNYDVRMFFVFE